MRALALIAFQALEQRGRIDAFRQSEIFAADLAVAVHLAEILALANDRTGKHQFFVYVVFGNAHGRFSLSQPLDQSV